MTLLSIPYYYNTLIMHVPKFLIMKLLSSPNWYTPCQFNRTSRWSNMDLFKWCTVNRGNKLIHAWVPWARSNLTFIPPPFVVNHVYLFLLKPRSINRQLFTTLQNPSICLSCRTLPPYCSWARELRWSHQYITKAEIHLGTEIVTNAKTYTDWS